MSGRERDRLKVLHEVRRGQLTQRGAAKQLGITERWVRKLLVRIKQQGDGGIVHGLRGRESNRRLAEKVRTRIVKLVKAKCRDFGPTLASEYLAQNDGVKVSKETVRQVLMAAGLRRASGRRVEEVHTWRPRRSCRGELVQWDTSVHEWLEGRGPRLYLVAMIDDATSQAHARFVEADSTVENLGVLWGYVERWGRPVEFYTDKSSLFTVNRPVVEAADEVAKEEYTQIGRALRELGIGWIAAHSPQAKGRIERFFGTAQDRLVKGLRLAGAESLDAAQVYLEKEYLPHWNETFTVPPAGTVNAHRPLGKEHDLAAILSQVEERYVAADYTIRYQGKIYQIPRSEVRPGLRGGRVRVEERLDGTVAVKFRQHLLNVAECSARVPAPAPRRPVPARKPRPQTPHNWMVGFTVSQSRPLGAILAAERGQEWKNTATEPTVLEG